MPTNPFERLHPALQYHIVNSIGWAELRDVQEACVEPILAGEDVVILARTAGGKTEAAFFPLLSRMLAEGWSGLSILYVSPLRALLNNQEARLIRYFELVGHRVGTWHGDVSAGNKNRLLKETPNCLLTTPESLEAILCSRRVEPQALFANVRAVVIDEVHAFAGDDRGWHLLAVLSRLSVIAGRSLQRIGLSATVGNPEQLAEWMNARGGGKWRVVRPGAGAGRATAGASAGKGTAVDEAVAGPEVQLDYVGSLANAATVIARLHAGMKRLVFADSRAVVEQLAALLRDAGVRTFITHSSLSRDVRQQAEAAFSEERDCVICATSALELGIDIGDLDHVIQIDSPGSVASFLQRMGRTGRRAGAVTNCLFLATEEERLLDCAALLRLWEEGYIEPIVPPAMPYHLFAQQVMALALQTRGLARGAWDQWLALVPAFVEMAEVDRRAIVEGMITKGLLAETDGLLWFGKKGEREFGRKNFLELLSVFTTPPSLTVLHGRTEIGTLDLTALQMQIRGLREQDEDGPVVLTLAGKNWRVAHVDWTRHVVHVEEWAAPGRARWLGSGRLVPFAMAQARLSVLLSSENSARWSKRATGAMAEVRAGYRWMRPDSIVLQREAGDPWTAWTFAGSKANKALADSVALSGEEDAVPGPWWVRLGGDADFHEVAPTISTVVSALSDGFRGPVPDAAIDGLKFGVCLDRQVAVQMFQKRLEDAEGVQHLRRCRVVGVDSPPDGPGESNRRKGWFNTDRGGLASQG